MPFLLSVDHIVRRRTELSDSRNKNQRGTITKIFQDGKYVKIIWEGDLADIVELRRNIKRDSDDFMTNAKHCQGVRHRKKKRKEIEENFTKKAETDYLEKYRTEIRERGNIDIDADLVELEEFFIKVRKEEEEEATALAAAEAKEALDAVLIKGIYSRDNNGVESINIGGVDLEFAPKTEPTQVMSPLGNGKRKLNYEDDDDNGEDLELTTTDFDNKHTSNSCNDNRTIEDNHGGNIINSHNSDGCSSSSSSDGSSSDGSSGCSRGIIAATHFQFSNEVDLEFAAKTEPAQDMSSLGNRKRQLNYEDDVDNSSNSSSSRGAADVIAATQFYNKPSSFQLNYEDDVDNSSNSSSSRGATDVIAATHFYNKPSSFSQSQKTISLRESVNLASSALMLAHDEAAKVASVLSTRLEYLNTLCIRIENCVRNKHGSTMYLSGEPGVGKTFVLKEFIRTLRGDNEPINSSLLSSEQPISHFQMRDAIPAVANGSLLIFTITCTGLYDDKVIEILDALKLKKMTTIEGS